MRIFVVLLSLLLAVYPAAAQTQQTIFQAIQTQIPDNVTGQVTPASVRSVMVLLNNAIFNNATAPNFTNGFTTTPASPGTVTSDPGQYNCFFGSTIYCGDTTPISLSAPGFTDAGVSGIAVGAPNGAIAGLFGTKCSLGTGSGYLSCGAALQALTYADNTQANNTGIFTQYNQSILLASSDPVAVGGGRAYGAELAEMSVQSFWGYVSGTDPYSYNATGSVHGLRIDCGTGSGSSNNCGGFAYEVVPNTLEFTGGYLCGNSSLVSLTILGSSGLGQCRAMSDGHALAWFSAAGTYAASLSEKVGGSQAFLNFNVATGGAHQFQVNGATQFAVESTLMYPASNNAFALGTTGLAWSNINSVIYTANGTAGVACTGSPTSSFASIGGIVTHC